MHSGVMTDHSVLNDLLREKNYSIKMVACDMDGTLLNDQHILSPRTIESIQKVVDSGIIVLLATGRMEEAVQEHLDILGTSGIVVTHNGALIKDIKTKKVYHRETVPADIARAVVKWGKENDVAIHLNYDDCIYVESPNPYSEKFSKDLKVSLNYFFPFEHGDEPISILLMGDKEILESILTKVSGHFEGALDYVFIPWYGEVWQLQFLPPNTSKGKGVCKVAELLGIDFDEIVSFGDSYNDMEMIRSSGVGIAMGNAVPELKEAADYITLSNVEDGVASVLEVLTDR